MAVNKRGNMYLPGQSERGNDPVADRDRFDVAAGLDDGADELVTHDISRGGRRLVAAKDVEFPGREEKGSVRAPST